MTSKVKDPAVYYNQGSVRERAVYTDALQRFRSRWRQDYEGGISAVRSAGFGSYDLARDGLNYPRAYGASHVVDRIVRQRAGEKYLLGIELECENTGRTSEISDLFQRYLPDRHICVSDGSLRGESLELVTSPLAVSEIGRVQWYNLLRELSRLGVTSHDSGRCGLHVSISRGYLRESSWYSLRAFMTRKSAFFKAISRRENGGRSNPFEFCEFRNRDAKYTALNLSKSQVAEFRFFRGTLKVESFLASLEVVRALVEYARDREVAGKSLRAQGFAKFLKRFPVAAKYCADHLDLLRVSRSGSGSSRRRLTDQDRLMRVARHLSESNSWDLRVTCNDSGALFGESSYPSARLPIAWGVGVETHEEARSIGYRIDWDQCRLPAYIRRLVDRGCAPREITITARQVPDRECVAVFRYYRGGWGNSSRYGVELVPVRGASV
jgi:hypothetical protein